MTTLEQSHPTSERPVESGQPAQHSALARLAGWCHDHRWWVLVIWVVALVGVNFGAQALGSNFSNNLSGGTQSAQQILDTQFPAFSGSPAQVVITTSAPFTDPANQARTERLVAALTPLPHVAKVTSPFSPQGAAQISQGCLLYTSPSPRD